MSPSPSETVLKPTIIVNNHQIPFRHVSKILWPRCHQGSWESCCRVREMRSNGLNEYWLLSIIAVHGLGGHREKTWTLQTKNQSGGVTNVMWLKDFLHEDVPEARILNYGYDAVLFGYGARSKEPIHRHALNLLARLSAYRKRTRVGSPLSRIFSINSISNECQIDWTPTDHLRCA